MTNEEITVKCMLISWGIMRYPPYIQGSRTSIVSDLYASYETFRKAYFLLFLRPTFFSMKVVHLFSFLWYTHYKIITGHHHKVQFMSADLRLLNCCFGWCWYNCCCRTVFEILLYFSYIVNVIKVEKVIN